MRVLSWTFVAIWTLILAATALVFGTCEYDCSDSGGLQGTIMVTALSPATAFSVWFLVHSGVGASGRCLLLAFTAVCAVSLVCLVLVFVEPFGWTV